MKIALLTDGIPPYVLGGMQTHSALLGKTLVKKGNSVDLFHFIHKPNGLPTENEVNKMIFENSNFCFNKVFTYYFPQSVKFPGHYIWNSYRYSKMVANHLMKESGYDLIIAKGFSGWKLLIEKKRNRIQTKIGVKFHGYEMFQFAPNLKIKLQHLFLRVFVRWNTKHADYVYSYGGKITTIIENLGVSKELIKEIPSAIDPSWLNQNIKTSQSLKFLFVGRNERRKGIKEINKAIELVLKNNLDAEFHFMGPVEKRFNTSRSNVSIFYHGIIIGEKRKKEIYDSCDVLLCPSYSEGMPNVILEAMSRGLAIIATNVGAIRLLVSENNGALLKECKTNLIFDAINKFILMDYNKLTDMKTASVEKIKEEFLWNNVIEKYIEK